MKKRLILLALVAFILGACAASPAQLQALESAVRSASADGVISPAELPAIIAQLPSPGFDWAKALEVGGSIVASLVGVKLIPDRHLRSPFESQPSQPPS